MCQPVRAIFYLPGYAKQLENSSRAVCSCFIKQFLENDRETWKRRLHHAWIPRASDFPSTPRVAFASSRQYSTRNRHADKYPRLMSTVFHEAISPVPGETLSVDRLTGNRYDSTRNVHEARSKHYLLPRFLARTIPFLLRAIPVDSLSRTNMREQ